MEQEPKKEKKLDLKAKKESTIGSLYEVEHFLCNFTQICKSIQLYKFFKH